MSNRFIKQLIFGVFYLILFSAIGYGLYFLAWRPASSCFDNRQNQGEEEIDCGGPCQPCALKNLKPIDIFSQPQLLEIDGQTGALHFQLKNSNDAGADRFSYSVDFYDAGGEKIQSLSNDSFIYARQVKTIVEAPLLLILLAVLCGIAAVLTYRYSYYLFEEGAKSSEEMKREMLARAVLSVIAFVAPLAINRFIDFNAALIVAIAEILLIIMFGYFKGSAGLKSKAEEF